jgi:periplasmic divalent cation tolerance protein
VEDSSEFLLVIKSSRALLDRLRLEIETLHSYEIPELIAVSIVDGAPNYLNWLEAETAGQV